MKPTIFHFLLLFSVVINMQCNLDRIDDAGPFVCGQLFTDSRDGKTYKTIWIANDGSHDTSKPGSCWMAENLNFIMLNDSSMCYENQQSRCDTFGRLYAKTALATACMDGWHIATSIEWANLFKTYQWTEMAIFDQTNYSGDNSEFLPGGNTRLDFLMGGSCSVNFICNGINKDISFWATNPSQVFSSMNYNKDDDASIALILPAVLDNLRLYVRCVKN
jgi:uncharacterized protein (TIGR02145 family)